MPPTATITGLSLSLLPQLSFSFLYLFCLSLSSSFPGKVIGKDRPVPAFHNRLLWLSLEWQGHSNETLSYIDVTTLQPHKSNCETVSIIFLLLKWPYKSSHHRAFLSRMWRLLSVQSDRGTVALPKNTMWYGWSLPWICPCSHWKSK